MRRQILRDGRDQGWHAGSSAALREDESLTSMKGQLLAQLKGAPQTPGVYWMLDAGRSLLYVGKARNLRARLRWYGRLKAGEDPRVEGMLSEVETLRWELCRTQEEALRRETELIRTLRPRFNATHAEISEAVAVAIIERGSRIRLRLAAESSDETETLYFYPYAASTPLGFTALLRLLFALGSSRASPPTNPRRASGWELEIPSHVQRALRSFLAGRSPSLLALVRAAAATWKLRDPVRLLSLEKDLTQAERFYRHGPQAVRRLQLAHGGAGAASAAELDRLLATEYRAQVGVESSVMVSTEELVRSLAAEGLAVAEITRRLNHAAAPRPAGSGRWRVTDVLDLLKPVAPQT